ncbi:MAG: flagellar biosynthesis anti-sigma factor FlgM [Chitinivibrionia bacterium]|jgi:anti-sigma28 factor (negative regulator of flagellin synthesis)|nr:flagellar biosynthesis anti-sigma factor FlgM [Chitinivibrionia bacterium]
MYLGTIQSTVAADFRKIDGVSRKEDAKVDNVVGKKTDKTSLSSEAREAVETAAAVKVLSARVEAQPDIRQDKVDAVRQKIDSGFYESQEFASNLADKLIGDLGF